MTPNKQAKTIQVGDNVFTIMGERAGDGSLQFTVYDFDCVLTGPDDEIARQFHEALKLRLKALRGQRC